jgi:hypothetical protein
LNTAAFDKAYPCTFKDQNSPKAPESEFSLCFAEWLCQDSLLCDSKTEQDLG